MRTFEESSQVKPCWFCQSKSLVKIVVGDHCWYFRIRSSPLLFCEGLGLVQAFYQIVGKQKNRWQKKSRHVSLLFKGKWKSKHMTMEFSNFQSWTWCAKENLRPRMRGGTRRVLSLQPNEMMVVVQGSTPKRCRFGLIQPILHVRKYLLGISICIYIVFYLYIYLSRTIPWVYFF